jgi:aspartyl protease
MKKLSFLNWPKTLLVVLLLLTGCASVEPELSIKRPAAVLDNSFTLPYQMQEDGLILVVVKLDGTPYTFTLDSGATLTAIYPSVARQLGYEINPERTVRIHGIIQSASRPLLDIQNFKFGNLTREDMRIVVLKERFNPESDGILGMDVLAGYAILFNRKDRTLTFMDSRKVPMQWRRDWRRIPLNDNPYLEDDFTLTFLQANLGNYTIPALLDLGSSISIQNWASAKNSKLRSIRRRLEKQWKLEGANGTFRPRILATYEAIRSGPQYWLNRDIYVRDLESLKILGIEDKPLMIMGMNFFRDTTFLADFPAMTLYVKPESGDDTASIKAQTGSRVRGGGNAIIRLGVGNPIDGPGGN